MKTKKIFLPVTAQRRNHRKLRHEKPKFAWNEGQVGQSPQPLPSVPSQNDVHSGPHSPLTFQQKPLAVPVPQNNPSSGNVISPAPAYENWGKRKPANSPHVFPPEPQLPQKQPLENAKGLQVGPSEAPLVSHAGQPGGYSPANPFPRRNVHVPISFPNRIAIREYTRPIVRSRVSPLNSGVYRKTPYKPEPAKPARTDYYDYADSDQESQNEQSHTSQKRVNTESREPLTSYDPASVERGESKEDTKTAVPSQSVKPVETQPQAQTYNQQSAPVSAKEIAEREDGGKKKRNHHKRHYY